MADDDKGKAGAALVVGGAIGAGVVALFKARPAVAAPIDEKWDYLIKCQETVIKLLQQLIAVRAEVGVSVSTPWVAKDPEQIYSYAIRAIGTFFTDRMVDWTRGKRFLFKVESTLDVPCQVQVLGNFVDNIPMASNVNGIINIAADENHTIGLAWDDWHPFVGLRIDTVVAPAAGILTVWAVIQE